MNLKSGLILIIVVGIYPLFGQSGQNFNKRLPRQFINLTDSRDFSGMQILDSALQTNRLMVLGVNHYYPEITRTVSVKFISYARKKADYRYFLAPVSPVCGEWLDRFVYQNDFSALNDLSLVLEPQDMLFYKRLNKINEGISDSLKIRIIGVDTDNRSLTPALGIYNLLKDKNPPDRLRIPVEALQGAIRYQQLTNDSSYIYGKESGFSVKNTFRNFSRSFDTLRDAYQVWLGDSEWFRIQALVNSLKASIYYETLKNTAFEDPYRVQQVTESIKNTMLRFPNERFVSLIGRCYASKTWLQGSCQLYNFSPICSKLCEDSLLGNRFFNVGVYYSDATDTDDEPQVIKSMLSTIRSEISASSAALLLCGNGHTLQPFNFMLVMGGNTGNSDGRSGNLSPQITTRIKPRSVFSASVSMGFHRVDIKTLSNLMAGYGLPRIDLVPDYGLNISTRDKENFVYEAGFFQRAKTPGSAYHYRGTYISVTNAFYKATPWLKAGLGINISYQQHFVNNPNALDDTIFISRYPPPTRAVKPVLIFGVSAKGETSFSRFFLTAEVGYGRDFTDQRWRVNNQYSGTMGKFKGNQIFINIASGFHLFSVKPSNRKGNQ